MTESRFTRPRPTRRLVTSIAAATLALAASVGTVLAWQAPVLQADCAPDQNHYAWDIILSQEPNYKIQFSWSSDFSDSWLIDFGTPGLHDFSTDRGGDTLYARWKDDKAKKTSAAADGELCEPEPTPSSTPTEEPTATPTEVPTPTPTEVPTPTPTEVPTATPTPEESEQGATSTPTPTPEQSIEGATGTPAPSLPDSAMADGAGPSPLPTVFFGLILLASLATLAWVNVKHAVRSRS